MHKRMRSTFSYSECILRVKTFAYLLTSLYSPMPTINSKDLLLTSVTLPPALKKKKEKFITRSKKRLPSHTNVTVTVLNVQTLGCHIHFLQNLGEDLGLQKKETKVYKGLSSNGVFSSRSDLRRLTMEAPF